MGRATPCDGERTTRVEEPEPARRCSGDAVRVWMEPAELAEGDFL